MNTVLHDLFWDRNGANFKYAPCDLDNLVEQGLAVKCSNGYFASFRGGELASEWYRKGNFGWKSTPEDDKWFIEKYCGISLPNRRIK